MDNWETHDGMDAIAVIRMAGRFPGTKNVDKFWQNLRDGVESISLIGEQEEIEL
ncbi:beta-ketoacyl synthase (plasmid) [Scytonema sp. HK-05]|jgi:acyl transferase domain-containing protein|uniref:beta-ketoacyl synthase N-terminal-like domain-containing protein n=1 Tax=Scytonema sp. HK-05 TaxID=1137095 RepID=UPI000ADA7FA3|nr:beta-ketoacyl synthase N-terminal-like domain-containing protein [Scytonema sp. HK-05]BAY50151.1 beta-ketoacyl synthase [Scytonema sp. HK-05]